MAVLLYTRNNFGVSWEDTAAVDMNKDRMEDVFDSGYLFDKALILTEN